MCESHTGSLFIYASVLQPKTTILLSTYENLKGVYVKFSYHTDWLVSRPHCQEMFIFIQALALGTEILITSNGPLNGLSVPLTTVQLRSKPWWRAH